MMTPTDERAHAYLAVVEDRIWELWRYRHWYRVNAGWIPDSRDEDREELRNLVRLARKARNLSRKPSTPTLRYLGDSGDPSTRWHYDLDR